MQRGILSVITTTYYDMPIIVIIVKILNIPTSTIYYNTNFNLFHLLIINFYTNTDEHSLRVETCRTPIVLIVKVYILV
jgi:hypothetical protein